MLRILFILWTTLATIYGNVLTTPADQILVDQNKGNVTNDGDVPRRRMLGGIDIDIEEAPYQVSVRKFGIHSCGGSIIDQFNVLTAAGCIKNTKPSEISIQYGLTLVGGHRNVIKLTYFTIHPAYDSLTNDNDVAVLHLESPINFSNAAKAIFLAYYSPGAGDQLSFTGWGRIWEGGSVSNSLQKIQLKEIHRQDCQKQYTSHVISEEMLCAAAEEDNKGPCDGDMGGPLTNGLSQYGIFSWSYGCGSRNYPGVYTNVAKHREWIIENSIKLWPHSARGGDDNSGLTTVNADD